jgi:TerC family integral membrane protein
MPQTAASPVAWIGFTILILILLLLDLGLFHRTAHAVKPKEALLWTIFWVSLALLFDAGVYWKLGSARGLEFFTGYLVEYALSIDNIFVFILIFRYFKTPAESHHRALFWGIVGALVLRGSFILAGTVLLQAFHWLIYVMGAFLIYTGYKMLRSGEVEVDPQKNPVVRLFQRAMPTASEYHGARLTVRKGGRLLATPLLVVLVAISVIDVVFAVDSIPAVFGVTREPFIVYTSNIFAILGLRSLYFLVEGALNRFHHLSTGLALVLAFIGGKMIASYWHELSIGVSLGVVVALLGGAVIWSLLSPAPEASEAKPAAPSAAEISKIVEP